MGIEIILKNGGITLGPNRDWELQNEPGRTCPNLCCRSQKTSEEKKMLKGHFNLWKSAVFWKKDIIHYRLEFSAFVQKVLVK